MFRFKMGGDAFNAAQNPFRPMPIVSPLAPRATSTWTIQPPSQPSYRLDDPTKTGTVPPPMQSSYVGIDIGPAVPLMPGGATGWFPGKTIPKPPTTTAPTTQNPVINPIVASPWSRTAAFAQVPAHFAPALAKIITAQAAAKAVLTNTAAPSDAAGKAVDAIMNPGGASSSTATAPIEASFFDNAMFKKPSFWIGSAAFAGMIAFLAKTNNGGSHRRKPASSHR